MKKSTFFGSTIGVLLLFSVISYSRTFVQQQDPKPVQTTQQPVSQANPATGTTESSELKDANAAVPADSKAESDRVISAPAKSAEPVILAETYTATAYSLRGRTASGKPVARGLIAADPRVLPLGTRVRIDAGELSGEYIVADTGGAVKGRRVDIWTPTTREAMRFGRRAVKLTVLELGGKRSKSASMRPRRVMAVTSATAAEQVTRQNQ